MEAIPITAPARTAGVVVFDEPRNLIWYVGADADLHTVRLLDGAEAAFGGYTDPLAVLPLGDGLSVAVVEVDGRIRVAPRDDPDGGTAADTITLNPAPHVADRGLSPFEIVLDSGDQLLVVDARSGDVTVAATGAANLTSLVVDRAAACAYAVADAPASPQIVRTDLSGQPVEQLATLPSGAWMLLSHPDGGGVLAVDSQGTITVVYDDGTVDASAQGTGVAASGICRWGLLLLAVGDDAVHPVEWNLDPGPLGLTLPIAPLFVSGFAELTFDAAEVGLTPDEIEFVVPEGPDAATVSVATEPVLSDGRARRMLVAGWMPGEYHLVAQDRNTGAELAVRRFRITTLWPDRVFGPPIVSAGVEAGYRTLSWGGAGGITGYLDDAPTPPNPFRVGVVLLETNQRAYGATLATATTNWENHVIGAGESARTYYEEVSYFDGGGSGMTIELAGGRILGPVPIDAGWGDLFTYRKGSGFYRGWSSTRDSQARMAADVSAWLMDQPDGYDIFKTADAFVFVIRSGSDGPTLIGTKLAGTMFVWGHKAGESPNFSGKDAATSTLTQGPRPLVLMTDVYPAVVGKIPARTLAHELGHVLELDDLYDVKDAFGDDAAQRIAEDGDLMATSGSMPYLSLANRIRLGWVKRSALRKFDFSVSPTGASMVLRASADLTAVGAPPGEFAGIEVIRDGLRSYIFEYRRQAAATVGDQFLTTTLEPTGELLLGTDVSGSTNDPGRPPILFLHKDVDGDGPVLGTSDDYEESDVTDPARMWDFDVSFDNIDPAQRNRANVTVDYRGAHRPQLILHPAPGAGNFRSKDVRLVDPFGADTHVVKGAPNTIRITVHNAGTLAATDVVTRVSWLPFTVAPGSWNALPAPPVIPSVPANGQVSIDVQWTPPASVKLKGVDVQHFCVRAEIERFRNPLNPGEDEITVYDNWAQSNFDTAPVAHGSPSERVRTVLGMANVLPRRTTYHLNVRQSRGMFRVYLQHAWLMMDAESEVAVDLAYESLVDDPVHGEEIGRLGSSLMEIPNRVALTTKREPDGEDDCITPKDWFGVSLALSSGRRTWFEDVEFVGEIVRARVFTSQDGASVPLPAGDVTIAAWLPGERDAPARSNARVDEGDVYVPIPETIWGAVQSGREVLGCLRLAQTPEYAPTVSRIIRIG